MTIYQLYSENGNRAGFWVQHRNWSNMCARVLSIGGLQSGRLPGELTTIRVQCFDVRSGRPLANELFSQAPDDKHFAPIAEPAWY